MKFLLSSFFILLFFSCDYRQEPEHVKINTSQGMSLLNKPLIRRQVNLKQDSLQIMNYLDALHNYEVSKISTNNIIWLGRRVAYLGDYKRAIEIYSEGINVSPDEARFYRHRGHRYISTRQLDKAIKDFTIAVSLIENTKDVIEQDGIPNKLNQPVSSLHTNIYYHQGLAYYLKGDFRMAQTAFTNCLEVSKNDDMQVATRHWLYMIMKRTGLHKQAEAILVPIHKNMTIIENTAYHNLLLFYKGIISENELVGDDSLGSNEAVKYGLGNWYLYNDHKEKAVQIFEEMIKSGNWAGFGYLAAEADMSRIQ